MACCFGSRVEPWMEVPGRRAGGLLNLRWGARASTFTSRQSRIAVWSKRPASLDSASGWETPRSLPPPHPNCAHIPPRAQLPSANSSCAPPLIYPTRSESFSLSATASMWDRSACSAPLTPTRWTFRTRRTRHRLGVQRARRHCHRGAAKRRRRDGVRDRGPRHRRRAQAPRAEHGRVRSGPDSPSTSTRLVSGSSG